MIEKFNTKYFEELRDPSPIKSRICKCGCHHDFTPKRTNQFYLNAKHRDYHYNHGVRKEKNKSLTEMNKILSKNLRILIKYHESKSSINSTYLLKTLTNEGFNPSQFTGITLYKGDKFSFCYNYAYQIITIKNQEHIKIYKNEST